MTAVLSRLEIIKLDWLLADDATWRKSLCNARADDVSIPLFKLLRQRLAGESSRRESAVLIPGDPLVAESELLSIAWNVPNIEKKVFILNNSPEFPLRAKACKPGASFEPVCWFGTPAGAPLSSWETVKSPGFQVLRSENLSPGTRGLFLLGSAMTGDVH